MKTCLSVLSFGLLSLVLVSHARGQEQAVDSARASFQAGVELFKEGSFEGSLAEFKKAYQTSPSYRVLYNIAQVYFELHDYVNSYATLKDYVEQGGSDISAARLAQVEELNRKLEKRIGTVEIVCDVNDADIRIDDISVGKSPLESPVLVNAGPRRIAAVKTGYPVSARIVTLAGMERATVKLEVTLPPEAKPERPVAAPATTTVLAKDPSAMPDALAPLPRSHRKGIVVSLSVAGVSALATGIFGWQMLKAKSDFDREVAKTPYSKSIADSARSRALAYNILTDGFAAATLLSGGVALYLALTDNAESGQRQRANRNRSIAVVPAAHGLMVHGVW